MKKISMLEAVALYPCCAICAVFPDGSDTLLADNGYKRHDIFKLAADGCTFFIDEN